MTADSAGQDGSGRQDDAERAVPARIPAPRRADSPSTGTVARQAALAARAAWMPRQRQVGARGPVPWSAGRGARDAVAGRRRGGSAGPRQRGLRRRAGRVLARAVAAVLRIR